MMENNPDEPSGQTKCNTSTPIFTKIVNWEQKLHKNWPEFEENSGDKGTLIIFNCHAIPTGDFD